MKALNLFMGERTYSGIMAYRDLYGLRGNVRDTAERMIIELIDSKADLKKATENREQLYNK